MRRDVRGEVGQISGGGLRRPEDGVVEDGAGGRREGGAPSLPDMASFEMELAWRREALSRRIYGPRPSARLATGTI